MLDAQFCQGCTRAVLKYNMEGPLVWGPPQVQNPLHRCVKSVCTLPAIYAAPKVAGGFCKQTDEHGFRVAEPAHEGRAHDLGQANGSRVVERAHMVKVHDLQVLESRVTEPAHATSERLKESRYTGILLRRVHEIRRGPMHRGRLLRRLITSPAIVFLTF